MEKTTILESLDDLLVSEIQHLFSIKEQKLNLLSEMIQKVGDRQLRRTLVSFQEEVKQQKTRLEQISIKFNLELEEDNYKSMAGLVEEAKGFMAMDTTPDIMDAGLTATMQRIANLELASYGTVCNYAYILGYEEVGQLLHESLKEQIEAQEKLNKLATEKINERAL